MFTLEQLARSAGIEFLQHLPRPDPSAVRTVPAALARRLRIMPLAWDESLSPRHLRIAISDPTNITSWEEASVLLKTPITLVCTLDSEIDSAIQMHYGGTEPQTLS